MRRCDRLQGFARRAAFAKIASAPVALDQRAHPARRRFASARKGEKRKAEPRRDIARFAGRALRGEPIVARESDGEHSVWRSLEAHVRVNVAKRQAPLRVKDEAELRRQSAQVLVIPEPCLERCDARSEVERFRIDVIERTSNDVAQALDLGIGVDESRVLKPRMQVGKRALSQPSQVQIGAG